eukprot:3835893-Rhodomonas_salina.3
MLLSANHIGAPANAHAHAHAVISLRLRLHSALQISCTPNILCLPQISTAPPSLAAQHTTAPPSI